MARIVRFIAVAAATLLVGSEVWTERRGMAIEEKKKSSSGKAKKAAKRKLSALEANTAFNSTVGAEEKFEKKQTGTQSKSRDFESDLLEYLSNWERRESIPWKFNKVLQAWALSNVFDKEKISSSTFKQLSPYLKSVQGGARTRLLEEINKVISDAESQVEEGAEGAGEGGISEKTLKRAIKLKKLLDE